MNIIIGLDNALTGIVAGVAVDLNFSSGTFGRITSITGNPRIMQFGVKFAFWERRYGTARA